jgi:DNA-nicking Smr family endonuclease
MTGRRSRRLSGEEHELWVTVTRSVAPLKRRRKAAVEAEVAEAAASEPPPVEAPKKHRAAAAPTPVAPRAPRKAPPLAPIDRRTKQKLARGVDAIDARIDLHGMTQSEAHYALARFLRAAQHDGARMVLVITGKGARGADDPDRERGVLKRQVPLWLESAELRPFVIGYDAASHGHGGQGALYVRVRRER